jgi:hypothetical protein
MWWGGRKKLGQTGWWGERKAHAAFANGKGFQVVEEVCLKTDSNKTHTHHMMKKTPQTHYTLPHQPLAKDQKWTFVVNAHFVSPAQSNSRRVEQR